MPELRKDPIVDRWVIISTERARRPNDFRAEPEPSPGGFSPFLTGNEGLTPPEVFQIGRDPKEPANSPGWRVRVVPNKFPALSDEGEVDYHGIGMFDMMNGIGAHEVVIESPDENWDLADATPQQMQDVLDAYIARAQALAQDERLRYTVIFRNKGMSAGASIAHPHSQIISLPIIPKQVKEKLLAARDHYNRKSRSIFTDMLRQELQTGERIVEENEHFVVLSPYAARFPFEVQIYPRRGGHDFTLISEAEKIALGDVLNRTLKRIRTALGDPAYNMMVHSAPIPHPTPGHSDSWSTIKEDFVWHIDILPRLTKVAGFEWGTGFYINPVPPEAATQFLRDAS